MFNQTFAIAVNTLIESIRQPIYAIILMVGGALITLSLYIAGFTLDNDNALMIEQSLSTILLGVTFLAVFIATNVLQKEIENKTVLSIISKPIPKPAFVIGKYLGVTTAITLALWVWTMTFLLTVRHKVMATAADTPDYPVVIFTLLAVVIAFAFAVWGNFFYRWVFASRFAVALAISLTLAYILALFINKEWAFQSPAVEFEHNERQLPQLLIALFMIFQFMAVITAIAIACSTRLRQFWTLTICLAIYFLGLTSDYFFGTHTETSAWAWIPYAAIPNLQYHWLADALLRKHPISPNYIFLVTSYTCLYIAAVMCLSIALFQTRETG